MSRPPLSPPSGPSSRPSSEAPHLELVGLAKRFGGVSVLEDLDLAVGRGEILALLGPSGSGKTTALRLLAGFETPDAGEIRLDGRDVARLPPERRGFGMVFQHYALFPHLTVGENVAFGLAAQGWTRDRRAERVVRMLELVDLAGLDARRVSEISGGQQQRVALARALAPEPAVLLLDEPLSNLDPALREQTRRELREVVREAGTTTVLVTHEQEEAFHVGDRVAVLHRGRLEQVARPETLYLEPATPFVARFVGRSTVIGGRVETAEPLVVRVGDARWRASSPGEVAAGDEVQVVVRPESLRSVAVDGAPAGALVGRVTERRFNGALTFATVEVGDLSTALEVRLEPGARLGVGEATAVVIDPSGPSPRVFPTVGVGA